jgi:hypothetical protein
MRLPYTNVNMMRHRRSIQPLYWPQVVEAAKARGIRGITLKVLAELYRPRPRIRVDEARMSA